MNNKKLLLIGFLGATAVALGAMGAHFLKAKIQTGLITTDQLDGFDKGVKYQMYHTLAMMILLILNHIQPSKYFEWASKLFFWGIVLFSCSLYFLCTRHLLGADWLKVLGPITPIGGICFMLGWLCLCMPLLKKNNSKN